MVDTVIFWVECLGAISFALSGILVAIKRQADPVGAFVLALTTAFGGGMIRDLFLGISPPNLFTDPDMGIQAAIALTIAMLCYLFAFFRRTATVIDRHKNDLILNLFDAIGLGVFCVTGVNVAISDGHADNIPLLIFTGCLTGVGGGILRDVFASTIPMVFRKHIYMLPAILGSLIYIYGRQILPELAAMLIATAFIITVRILAAIFRWNLPVPKGNSSEQPENGSSGEQRSPEK